MGCDFYADEDGVFRLILSSGSGKSWEWVVDGLDSEDKIYIHEIQGSKR